VLDLLAHPDLDPVPEPPIHNIARWWSITARIFLRRLRRAIEQTTTPDTPEQTLLLIAFCRTLIKLSNAAFNHQSMSFHEEQQSKLDLSHDMPALFCEDIEFVLTGAQQNPTGSSRIIQGDARTITIDSDPFDLLVTSPPYANRMSYIRELRPYMYWLGFLVNGRDAGELDWQCIGGTWGVATSRLTEWSADNTIYMPPYLITVLRAIAHEGNTNGRLLANYIAKYAQDMWTHFSQLGTILAHNARVHYIVGNSTFYGVLLPTEQLYADMLNELGFVDVAVRPVRKRNSKKELIEFDVSARWKG
jgi:hypothetical protein